MDLFSINIQFFLWSRSKTIALIKHCLYSALLTKYFFIETQERNPTQPQSIISRFQDQVYIYFIVYILFKLSWRYWGRSHHAMAISRTLEFGGASTGYILYYVQRSIWSPVKNLWRSLQKMVNSWKPLFSKIHSIVDVWQDSNFLNELNWKFARWNATSLITRTTANPDETWKLI